jgi:hypothetical protein
VRRAGEGPATSPTHVLVLATLGAPERRHRLARKSRKAQPEPEPSPVTTSRATVVDVERSFVGPEQAAAWLGGAGEDELAADLGVLNRVLHAHRLVAADPHVNVVRRGQALVARIGFGAGEQVAEGRWTEARELTPHVPRLRRLKALHPHARLAAVLSGRDRALVCEDLVLRARLDLDYGREREAALQVLVALDAALADLQADPSAEVLEPRLAELRTQREAIARAAQTALAGPLSNGDREAVAFTLGRIEAALRARAAAAQ